ncbi:MAG TPA: carboxymuconolactone decarboxylase family protein [Aromatoleum sp.]|uniref:carboxymuconolactone decarboxylase family protein n=1 Tax=Aromatoleum sp. TaxID=2307007 RepID=UPI002B45BFD7|nr:carboxymuconolactone decarboxylase family protein [Aromatoleum sp.]HJV26640.1 carboxymuconolactone decarboxylase family protein [Aromatoleum sp.]
MRDRNALFNSELLTELAPFTISGYDLFREVIETDGAVPAKLKGLFAAAAACNRRYPALARKELDRAARLGLTRNEAASALILLSSLRGEGAALSFDAMIREVYPPSAHQGHPAPHQPELVRAAPGEAEANFKAYFGTVPPALATLLRLAPKGADGYFLMRKGTIDCNQLDRKAAELMLIAVLASDYSPQAATHIRAARAVGATDEEMAEAILCAVPSAGIAAWMAAGVLIEAQ